MWNFIKIHTMYEIFKIITYGIRSDCAGADFITRKGNEAHSGLLSR
jgi:hypothetical protein